MIGQKHTRREFLQASTAATLAATIPATALRASPVTSHKATADSCIFLMLTGGPSQLDTWDPKPNAPSEIRSPFRPIATRTPGVHFTELFPKMAAMSDKFSLIRAMHHEHAPIHENGFQLLNTGRRFGDSESWPSVGSVITHLIPKWKIHNTRHLIIPVGQVDAGVNVDHGCGSAYLPNRTKFWPRAGNVSLINDKFEPNFGATRFGEDCYWATLLSDPLYPMVTVQMYPAIFNAVSWDCHADNGSLSTTLGDYRDSVAPTFDTAFTGLLNKLEESGRLDRTLVVAVGEFGRTPKLNGNGGRDHWSNCWTAIVAGGGVQGGRAIGESDATASEPKSRPVHCSELVATIYHAMGIPTTTTIPGPNGKPTRVVEAQPVRELF